MTKKEIVKQIAEKFKESQVLVKDIVQETFDLIVATLVEEGRIELRNFGVFEVKRRKPRRARNPRTNQPVDVEAKNVVTFQPGKVMEQSVRDAKKVVETKRRPSRSSTSRTSKPIFAKPGATHPDSDDDRNAVLARIGPADTDTETDLDDDDFGKSKLPLKPR